MNFSKIFLEKPVVKLKRFVEDIFHICQLSNFLLGVFFLIVSYRIEFFFSRVKRLVIKCQNIYYHIRITYYTIIGKELKLNIN